MNGPLTTTSATLSALVSTYDGVAGMPSLSDLAAFPPPTLAKWKLDYYQQVILVDERRFLVSEAVDHIHRVPPMTVEGTRKVVIHDGKCLIDVPETVWEVWRLYEERGKGEWGMRMLGRRSREGEEKNGEINIAREDRKDSIEYTPLKRICTSPILSYSIVH